jgi:hypothetical protein
MKGQMKGSYTQGRKGMKIDRMNMAFTAENMDYVRVMAGIRGLTMTQFVNDCLNADREKNGKVYRMAKELAKEIE